MAAAVQREALITRVEPSLKRDFEKIADQNFRPVSRELEVIIRKHVRESKESREGA